METNGLIENQGYFIVAHENYGGEGEHVFYIVLGYNPKTKQYVTWDCVDLRSFFWGHYFENELHAKKDYHDRLKNYYDRIPF